MSRLSRSPARILAALVLALTMGATGVLSDPSSITAMGRPGTGPGGKMAWLDLGAQFASLIPRELLGVIGQGGSLNYGSDNRLTILLLGSDTRGLGVSRTDTVMIMSIDKNTKKINVASIPRDTARILNPFTPSATDYFSPRINAILKQLKKSSATVDIAVQKFEEVLERELDIPLGTIDYYALTTFVGFNALVENVQPITVNNAKVISDPKFWDNPNFPKGVYFGVDSTYDLYAWQPGANPPLCDSLYKSSLPHPPAITWCHRALPYVRSRKGSGNSDFKRAARQQNFVFAAIQTVTGHSSGALPSLVNVANGQVAGKQLYTDIPYTDAGVALDLYNLLKTSTLNNSVVFAPNQYSTHIPGGTAYQLKLPAVRAWADLNLQ